MSAYVKRLFPEGKKILLAFAFLLICSCAITKIHHDRVTTPLTERETQSCDAACVQKIETSDGAEKCLAFTQGMADVCFREKNKPKRKGTLNGTFVNANPA